MDCQMPVMDGFEATQKIKEMPRYRQVPIIAFTANAAQRDWERAHFCGMCDLLKSRSRYLNLVNVCQNGQTRCQHRTPLHEAIFLCKSALLYLLLIVLSVVTPTRADTPALSILAAPAKFCRWVNSCNTGKPAATDDTLEQARNRPLSEWGSHPSRFRQFLLHKSGTLVSPLILLTTVIQGGGISKFHRRIWTRLKFIYTTSRIN